MKPSKSADDGEWVTVPLANPLDLTGGEATPEARDLFAGKWMTINVTVRKYFDLDGNEVDFVTWLRIHDPEKAKAYGLDEDPLPFSVLPGSAFGTPNDDDHDR